MDWNFIYKYNYENAIIKNRWKKNLTWELTFIKGSPKKKTKLNNLKDNWRIEVIKDAMRIKSYYIVHNFFFFFQGIGKDWT